jgi:MazG family protein
MNRNKSVAKAARTPHEPPADVEPNPAAPLVALIRRLRGPDGCPWDRQVTLSDLRSFLLEEAHELAAALDTQSWDAIREELGDLLFQTCFLSVIAAEAGAFTLADAADSVHTKMVDRHPHVFGGERLATAEAVHAAWEGRKLATVGQRSLLDGVTTSLPALVAARRLGEKASGVGFDWPDADGALEKVREELDEIASDRTRGGEHLEEEVGDALFALVSLGRKLGIDSERALALANLKFRTRFRALEEGLGEQLARGHEDPDVRTRMEELWEEAKTRERAAATLPP